MAKANSMQLFLAIQCLAAGLLGCPGDGSDGASPVLFFSSTPECRVIAGGFPSGFAPLPGTGNEAAVVQFAPPAVFTATPLQDRRGAVSPHIGSPDSHFGQGVWGHLM